MRGNDLKVIDGAAAGAWIKPGLEGEIGMVAEQATKGYEAYARILHPASDPEGNSVRWAEVAAACGATAHAEMQWNALTGALDPCTGPGTMWQGREPMTGEMDIDELDALCGILSAHTADPGHCYFGLCTIMSWEEAFSPDELKPLLRLPLGRDHIVLAGPLSAVEQIGWDWSRSGGSVSFWVARKGDGPPAKRAPVDRWTRRPPHLIWPSDHSWLFVSEVDFDSTLVGGRAQLIEAIVESPRLEAWVVEPTTSLTCDADKVNSSSR